MPPKIFKSPEEQERFESDRRAVEEALTLVRSDRKLQNELENIERPMAITTPLGAQRFTTFMATVPVALDFPTMKFAANQVDMMITSLSVEEVE